MTEPNAAFTNAESDNHWLDFTLLFHAIGMAFSIKRVSVALVGVIATFVFGTALDFVWPEGSRAKYYQAELGAKVTELTAYRLGNLDADLTPALTKDGAPVTFGVFDDAIDQIRLAEDEFIGGLTTLSFSGFVDAIERLWTTAAWMIHRHVVFTLIFFTGTALIWSFCGAMISRDVVLALTRDEDQSWNEMIAVGRTRFLDVFLATLLPVAIILVGAACLAIFGLFAAIPYLGDLLYVVCFIPFVVGGGLVMAGAAIFGGAASPMMPYAVTADGMDSADAAAATCSYALRRPARLAFYYLVTLIAGIVLVAFIKLFVGLALSLGGGAVSSTMKLGSVAIQQGEQTVQVSKPVAIWTPPTLAADAPFYGTLSAASVGRWHSLIRKLVKLCLMFVWAIIAAIAVSYGYSAAGVCYLLLRRSVDRTDITELALENADKDNDSAAADL